jgi:hypothetical protein
VGYGLEINLDPISGKGMGFLFTSEIVIQKRSLERRPWEG